MKIQEVIDEVNNTWGESTKKKVEKYFGIMLSGIHFLYLLEQL